MDGEGGKGRGRWGEYERSRQASRRHGLGG